MPDHCLGGPAGKCTFDARLFEIAGVSPSFRMDAGNPHEEQIRMDIVDAFNGRCAYRHDGVFFRADVLRSGSLQSKDARRAQGQCSGCVTTVMRKSAGKYAISSDVVVPPSTITTRPEMSFAPLQATFFFASIFTVLRSANGTVADEAGSAPPWTRCNALPPPVRGDHDEWCLLDTAKCALSALDSTSGLQRQAVED